MNTVLAVGFGPYPGEAANPAQEIIETLRAERWAPPGARLATLIAPTLWWRACEATLVFARRETPAALLLIGHAPGAPTAQFAEAGWNWAGTGADAAGLRWPGRALSPGGPERLPATLPAGALSRALASEGLVAAACEHGGDYVWNRCFFSALALGVAPLVGLMLAPTALESARATGRGGPSPLNRAELMAAAQAALRCAAAAAERRTAAA